MTKTVRTILISIGLAILYGAFVASQSFILITIFFRAGSSLNKVPAGLGDCLLDGLGLILSLAVTLHYLMRRRLKGLLRCLSALEAFIFVIPSIFALVFYGGFPAPFFQNEAMGLMIFQGVTMVSMLFTPILYALFYLYVVISRSITAYRRRASRGRAAGRRRPQR